MRFVNNPVEDSICYGLFADYVIPFAYANDVKALRQNIPSNGQGAFIVTYDFQSAAKEVALESGFPRIGLINGNQLVDILVEHWDDISIEFKEKLGLKKGLITL